MYRSILFPTDGSQLSQRAADTALQFAQLNGARLTVISVVQPTPFVPIADAVALPDAELLDRQMQQAAQHNLDQVQAAAMAAGVPCEAVLAQSTNPYEAIVKTAEERHCDIILMASHGRKGLNKLILGSETQKVLAHTDLPVLVLR